MNKQLIEKWNTTVHETDCVFFLGDVAHWRSKGVIDYYLRQLTGKISMIRGNHDTEIINSVLVIHSHYFIKYKDYQFLLMHNPYRPKWYDGWIIHGHTHNTKMKDYPFIHQKNKTINVSSELVDYTPVNLERIIMLIETSRNYKTIDG